MVIVQNNAEARTTGGNPASLMMLTADQGRISISQQAASTNFNNDRPEPIVDLDPGTEALYGTRVGKFIQDTTMSPSFDETARLVQAFWQEKYGDPGVGVLSLDPVALSYILKATGSVGLPDGEQLTSENAVQLLLNGVYFKYPNQSREDFAAQDAYFAAAAGGVFDKITSGSADIVKLAQAFGKAGAGAHLLRLDRPCRIKGSAGHDPLEPTARRQRGRDCAGRVRERHHRGKLDYYADMSIEAASDVCETEEAPTFTTKATYNYTLQPGEVAGLPAYISTGRLRPRCESHGPGLLRPGRRYVRVREGRRPGLRASCRDDGRGTARGPSADREPASYVSYDRGHLRRGRGQEYGPLDVVHTPLVKKVPVETSTPGCE
ncbi:DUF4012 domain-containing protein [Microbacterium barkeri]|uniref:DUF4012 domain-containing protein n=1 Tax=Microbacterium barkeri TaxID=33917 RepID=UPI003612D5D6